MENAKLGSKPLVNHFVLSAFQCLMDMEQVLYVSAIRYLMYVMVC